MNEIKFSHRYNKMPPYLGSTRIIEVFSAVYINLSPEFIEYDTSYPGGNYNVKNGLILVILLLSKWNDREYLWTTLRSYNPEKANYYKSLIGQSVRIYIEGE